MDSRSYALLDDEELAGLPALFELSRIKSAFEVRGDVDCEIAHVRYEPGAYCNLLYAANRHHAGLDEDPKYIGYGSCYDSKTFRELCRQAASEEWLKPPSGPPLVVSDENRTILFAYPNDPRLKGLRVVESETALRRFLGDHLTGDRLQPVSRPRTAMIRYKPEHRAVVRCRYEGPTRRAEIYLRVSPAGRANAQYEAMRRLFEWLERRRDLAIPLPLAASDDLGILVLDSLAGEDGSRAPDRYDAPVLGNIARALATLHSYCDPRLPVRTLADRLTETLKVVAKIRMFAPELETRPVSEALQARTPDEESPGFVHGGFRLDQVLLDSERVGLLDFDNAHQGDTTADLGSFLANLHYQSMRGRSSSAETLAAPFLTSYARAAHKSLDGRRLSWWTAVALLKMSTKPLRKLDFDGPQLTRRILERAASLLAAG